MAFDPPGRPYPDTRAANDRWFQHVAIVVADIEGVSARLERLSSRPISTGGPQLLPANTGGVTAFKFRDPDGHPLELLHFPPGVGDAVWRHGEGSGPLGYDHSAIVVEDLERSLSFYTGSSRLPCRRTVLEQGRRAGSSGRSERLRGRRRRARTRRCADAASRTAPLPPAAGPSPVHRRSSHRHRVDTSGASGRRSRRSGRSLEGGGRTFRFAGDRDAASRRPGRVGPRPRRTHDRADTMKFTMDRFHGSHGCGGVERLITAN